MNKIILGDARDVMPQFTEIDLIYCDPPYPRALARPCYQILADLAPGCLKDGGSLVTIAPHYLLEEVMDTMRGRLKYRWIYAMNQSFGPHPRMAMGVEILWKPILHYVKRAYPQGRGFLRDMVDIPAPQKNLHVWQQAEEWATYYIEKLCPPGGTVMDPFVGAGTVPAVCERLGRNYVGIDNDPNAIATTLERIDYVRRSNASS